MATNLLLSGGPGHDFEASSGVLSDVLAGAGVESVIFDDPREGCAALAARPGTWDLVTVNALHWQVASERHKHLRDRWAFTLREDEAQALVGHVRAGGALLACHAAVICFDGHPRWRECTGATWSWPRSSHPPQGPVLVSPTPAGEVHPLTAGISPFTTVDEVYGFLDMEPGLVPLLTSSHGGVDHPVLWARTVGRGRVVTDLLGHDAAAMAQAQHLEILRRAAHWLTAPPAEPGPLTSLDRSEPSHD